MFLRACPALLLNRQAKRELEIAAAGGHKV